MAEKSCLSSKKPEDTDQTDVEELVTQSLARMRKVCQ